MPPLAWPPSEICAVDLGAAAGASQFGAEPHANDLCNLGLAQKRCGELRRALVSYDAALRVNGGARNIRANRDRLLEETGHWTGTAREYDDVLAAAAGGGD